METFLLPTFMEGMFFINCFAIIKFYNILHRRPLIECAGDYNEVAIEID